MQFSVLNKMLGALDVPIETERERESERERAKVWRNDKHECSENIHPLGPSPFSRAGHTPLCNLPGDLCPHCGGEPTHHAGDYHGSPPAHTHVLLPEQPVLH